MVSEINGSEPGESKNIRGDWLLESGNIFARS